LTQGTRFQPAPSLTLETHSVAFDMMSCPMETQFRPHTNYWDA